MEAVQNLLNERVQTIRAWLGQRIVGQQALIHRLLMALISGGHLLVEGAPGLAKTRAIKELAAAVEGEFHRIQFTPDLLPSDVTGTEVFHPEDASFSFQKGPVFHNLLLADEVNRAPAKVQSALLEAMAEHQVSFGRETFQLPELFLVMATQNPIEQEGTYPLPEAQLDRFLLHVKVGYPDTDAEHEILKLVRGETLNHGVGKMPAVLTQAEVFAARREVAKMYMAPAVERYIVELIAASRGDIEGLEFGASPRGTIALDQCSRCAAWLDGRDFVTPDDVVGIAHDVLRHRLILTFEAEAKGLDADQIIDDLLNHVPVP